MTEHPYFWAKVPVIIGILLLLSGCGSPGNGGKRIVNYRSVTSSILSPALVLPRQGECIEQLVYDADGNVQPLLCPNGEVNVPAWKHYANLGYAPILGLGPQTDEHNAKAALCALQNATLPERLAEWTLVSAYHKWQFSPNPTAVLNGSGCASFPR